LILICYICANHLREARGTIPDADDTAKGIVTLHILRKKTEVSELIRMFEAEDHFRTYHGERNPSFSANCNVLICLLLQEDADKYVPQIAKAINFVTTQAFQGQVDEKWVSQKHERRGTEQNCEMREN
jgi:hypothetical protein